MIVSPDETQDGLLLSIFVSEAKYIDEASLAKKKKESQKQLRDTVRRIYDALFGNPDRLDRELWLARLSDLVLDGVQFAAGQTPQVSKWRHDIRAGKCKIMLRGYSHIFVHSPDFDDTNAFEIAETDNCYQEVFARKTLRDLVLAYWKGDSPTTIRNHFFDSPPSLNPYEFKTPTAILRKPKSNVPVRSTDGSENESSNQVGNTVTPSAEMEQTGNSELQSSGQGDLHPPQTGGSVAANQVCWAYDTIAGVVMQSSSNTQGSQGDDEWLKEIVKAQRQDSNNFSYKQNCWMRR